VTADRCPVAIGLLIRKPCGATPVIGTPDGRPTQIGPPPVRQVARALFHSHRMPHRACKRDLPDRHMGDIASTLESCANR